MSETESMKSPFEGVEAIFAADLEPVRHDFEMLGQPCYVELRPMDGSADARFRSKGQSIVVDTTRRVVESAQVVVDQDELEIELLLGTVVDFQLARRKKAKTGEEVVEITPPGKGMQPGSRKDIFRGLAREFRRRLVLLCCEVNGIDPNFLGLSPTGG